MNILAICTRRGAVEILWFRETGAGDLEMTNASGTYRLAFDRSVDPLVYRQDRRGLWRPTSIVVHTLTFLRERKT